MPRNVNFHVQPDTHLHLAQRLINTAVASGKITENDACIIRDFMAEAVATSHLSASRQYKLTNILVNNREFFEREYQRCSITDVFSAVSKIQFSTDSSGQPRYKQNTAKDHVMLVKRLFLWMSENDRSAITSEKDHRKLRNIKGPSADKQTITAEMILTEEEVRKILEVCDNTRDRAMMSTLYEGGFRIGEIGSLTWGQVKFTDWNVTINTAEKTGKPRYIPIIDSRQYLTQWKNEYPGKPDADAFVFLTLDKRHAPLQYRGLAKHIKILTKRAGIEKDIHPHLFRHSRITHLLQHGTLSETIIKLIMWGDVSSDMLARYQHLTNTDIDEQIAQYNGVKIPNKKETPKLRPIQCWNCGTINASTASFCVKCGKALTPSSTGDVEDIEHQLNELLTTDPVKAAQIMQKVAAKMIENAQMK